MWNAAIQPEASLLTQPLLGSTNWYAVLGISIAVSSDIDEILDRVDDSYSAFRQRKPATGAAFTFTLQQLDTQYLVEDSLGYQRYWHHMQPALLDLLDRIVHGVLTRLHEQGIYAVHAGAVVRQHAALIIAGRSGQGKTTLVLGLLRRGFSLLSDEFAILDPTTQQVMPYRRSLHIRPGTPELIPELRFLHEQPRHQLGGGIEWTLKPAAITRAFPGGLGEPAPLRYVLLLDGVPDPAARPAITAAPAALATMELLRGTWAASVDFAAGLATVSQFLHGVRCARLRAGALEPTLDCVVDWLGAPHG